MKVMDQKHGKCWTLYHADTMEAIRALPDRSVDYSVFSPPFASLYSYSNSERDIGNSKDYTTFWEHFNFLAPELHRIHAAGRLVSMHCMNLTSTKSRDGVIGLKDFRGDMVRAMESAGFIYHSEVCIWKDPVIAMQRTKSIGLLYKQLRKDSAMSRQGIPDYLVTFRKRDDNDKPITKTHTSFPVSRWQKYASPVWMDINPSDTLQRKSARDQKDEKHICLLQLEVIRRGIELWTNPGDVVFDPFAGIGSTGYVAVRTGRMFVGCELKPSYFKQGYLNLERAEKSLKTSPVYGDL